MGKPKQKHRILPVGLPSTTAVDLFLLAGLRNPLHLRIEDFLQTLAGDYAKVIAVASPSYDRWLYKQRTVDTLLNGAARFAIRRLKNRSDDQPARPRRIILFYVPAEDDQKLLAEFDFFVFPVPLRELATFDAEGHQRRHHREVCEQAIRKGMEVYTKELVGALQPRLKTRRSHEPLLLPPVNFHLPSQPLKQAFSELTRRARAWENALPEGMVAEMFDHERLPGFLDHQERQLIFQDERGVVFPCARASEFHGAQELDTRAGVSALREILRSTYRFGTSLPQGFHHDAQFEGGREFSGTRFSCSQEGDVSVSGSHVNIYPNDFVRPA